MYELSQLEWKFLFTGGLTLEPSLMNQFSWLSDKLWAEIIEYSEIRKNYKIIDHIQKYVITKP
jgi:hypothetical protein